MAANGLSDPDYLRVGQELVIPQADAAATSPTAPNLSGTITPTSGTYTVVEGDTLLGIAYHFNISLEELAQANGLSITGEDLLQIGQVLFLPASREPDPVTSRGGTRPVETAPDPVSTPVARSQAPRGGTYTVVAGDTLLAIASRLGTTAAELIRLNNLPNDGNTLAQGQILVIPGPPDVRYVVVKGDTLYGIARNYGATIDDIIAANGLQPPYLLSIGRELVIPGGNVSTKPAPAAAPTPQPQTQVAPAQPTPEPSPAPAPAPAPVLVSQVGNQQKGEEAAALAKRFVGYPYRWAGRSPDTGFDCSGLVWYIYQQVGLNVPRADLWAQLASGPRVDRSNLLPGDMVFFQNTYTSGLSHVGIYVGGGYFVSAQSESTGVTMTNLSASYWASRYLGASRPW
jgi:peptidoglycan endopeptidase LytE